MADTPVSSGPVVAGISAAMGIDGAVRVRWSEPGTGPYFGWYCFQLGPGAPTTVQATLTDVGGDGHVEFHIDAQGRIVTAFRTPALVLNGALTPVGLQLTIIDPAGRRERRG